jgi:molecular chaperone GrpE
MTPKKSDKQTPEDQLDSKLIDELKKQIDELQSTNDKLTTDLEEAQQMTKRAQHEYVNIKFDMERVQRQHEAAGKSAQRDALVASLKKILPFVDDLRKSLESMSDEVKSSQLAQGVQLVYDKFLSTLEEMKIYPIEAMGLEPDLTLHEPVGAQPAPEKSLQGKIINEFTRGFVYRDGDDQNVIITSKVVVGQ